MIYTLIAFSMIALVLVYAKPRIEEFQDKAIIEQSISMLEEIDTIILAIVQGGQGNVRVPKILIKKGELIIDGKDDKIQFEIESNYMYSEVGKDVEIGGMSARTTENGKYYTVTITKEYHSSLNITYADKDEVKSISKASTKQPLSIKNNGEDISWGTLCNPTYPISCDPDAIPVGSVAAGCSKKEATASTSYCKYKSEKITINMEIK